MGQYFQPVVVNKNGNPCAIFARCYDCHVMAKLMEHSFYNTFVGSVMEYLLRFPHSRIVWSGDYGPDTLKLYDKESHKWVSCNTYTKAYDMRLKGVQPYPIATRTFDGAYLINHTKRIYTQCNKRKNVEQWYHYPHPLPILTADSNGGGGSYCGIHQELVGSWKGDSLSVVLTFDNVPKGFKYVEYDFREV